MLPPPPVLLTALLLLPSSTLSLVLPRAGGPVLVPLGPDCKAFNPFLDDADALLAATHDDLLLSGRLPDPDSQAARVIYSFYLPLPDPKSVACRWQGCLEQCHGLEGCAAAYMADGIKTPAGYYGSDGGVPSRACLMFGQEVGEEDFLSGVEGVTNGTVGNLECS